MSETMQAARFNVDTGEFAVKETEVGHPGYGQVRVKVKAAGVCLSDVHLIAGYGKPPYLTTPEVTVGHENAGVIDEIGDGVEGWQPGDRVTLFAGEIRHGNFHTMGSDFDGGWADYVIASATSLVALAESISFEQGSILGDAVATPWAAIKITADVTAGESVGVWGLGGLGAHAIKLLRFVGAAPIIAVDPLEEARERALRYGADVALNPQDPDFAEKFMAATGGKGVDIAMDFAGHPAVQAQALNLLGYRGRLILVGLSFKPFTIEDSFSLSAKQQQLRGHYATDITLLQEIVHLVELGRLDFTESVSGTFPLAEAATAVKKLESKEGNPIRLVLLP